ncbi:hypothetical protein LMG27198_19890 [Methylocystis echinoides]|uniref:Uncharacterized protein n=2 Tax=Methylocystis echinoides TaxID=29468 RepID=A0A9W6GTV6_9HYPH|nr:hypothetical protein LMG27198_19890 [Methylocystis echinoides]
MATDPFESDAAREAYREAIESSFEASRALTDFLHLALKGEPVTPAAAIKAAAEAVKDAEAAWSLFARVSEPEQKAERPTFN